ncbi:hypothetical protein SLE2022_141280 [Rubroshorea leprosula]
MEFLSRVGDSFLYAIFDSLFEKLKEYLSDQLWDSKEEIHVHMESWKTLLPKIMAVLQHAEENQIANQFVQSSLDDLRDLAYDMEYILEEFVIDAKRSELIAESRPSKRQRNIFDVISNVFSGVTNIFSFNKAKPNQEIKSMVMDLSGRLQKIENGMCSLNLTNLALKLEDMSHKVAVRRLPESSLLEDKVWGRDRDKDAILQRLLEDGGSLEQDFVIPIVGMGGLGKTTLARLIYNDEKLKDRFDLKEWVCVSDEFDVAQITRTILEHVTDEKCEFVFSKLQEKLKEKLSGRKFFLVLDDVWNKEYGKWDVLKRPFMSGAPGSKIIVTTRNKDVGTMMRGDEGVYNLELLQDDACLPLFARHALGKENFDAHPNLQDVGEKLVKRCKRLPLALKTLCGVLRGKLRRDEWENVLNSDIWRSSEERSGILPALRLSYNHLPSHLKRCFAYCALFPHNYEFKEKELVLLWMAEGLLQQQSHGKKQMEEEIGHQYFHELLSRSLFQQSSTNKSRFVMHDLINDLAIDVAGEIYCNLEHSMGNEKLKNARHLSFTPHSYEISKRFIVLDKLKHLRTFLLLKVIDIHFGRYYLFKRILHDLPTLNRLRVLSLCHYYQISKLPVSFENLKHIRYIDLSGTSIKCIPESVGSLLFLQTLLLCSCRELSKLPVTIGNLIDLHHLDITDTPSLKEMPSGIGNLKNLLTLSKFIVGKASGMMTRLSNLKNLSQLQGRLSILDLQNVLNVQEAREANLDKILGLEELILEWIALDNDQKESVLEMQVLSLLKPHSNLKSLKISCYGGESFPKWVGDPLLFLNLSSMKLSCCERCTLLPSLGRLPILKELIIESMNSIKAISSEFYGQRDSFPSLVELVFKNMSNWEEWSSPARSAGEFPCLRKLVIENCPKLLGQLPSNLSSLKELDVRGCNGKLLKSLGDVSSLTYLRIKQISELICLPMSLPSLKELSIGDCNGVLLKSMVDLTSLTKLEIWKISELTCLPMSMSLPSLKELSIGDCNGVLLKSMVDLTSLTNLRIWKISEPTCLPMSMSLPSLKELSIGDCNGVLLKSMVDLTSLTNLRIWKISEPTCLPMSMSLPSLKELSIGDCNGVLLKSMVDLTSLTNLRIEQISELTCLPESFIQSCTALETLGIADCNDLTCLWEEGIEIEQSLLPFNLKHLSLKSCRALESLPNAMMMRMDGSSSSNTSMLMSRLERLEICGCNSLKSFPRGKLPHSLKYLRIENCEGLESLPDVDGDYYNSDLHSEIRNLPCFYSSQGSCHQLPAFLKEFTVTDGGEWLESFPEKMLQHCTRLQSISIGNLVRLSISDSEVLESLPKELALYTPNLNSLEIRYCENFKSLPNTMYQLKSLQNLLMQDCPSIESIPDGGLSPNLKHLQLDSCKNLKCVPNSMCRLTSLDELSVHGEALTMDLQNLTSLRSLGIEQKLPLDIVLPSSLTSLAIWFEENLESIPGKLFQNLSSLDSLFIQGCPKLRSLPREAFTPSLSELHITNCPHLEQHFEEKGDYWTLTWSIPCIEINE